MKVKTVKAKDFEQQFDEGVDITASLDFANAYMMTQANCCKMD